MPTLEAPALNRGVDPTIAVYDIGGTKSSAAIGGDRIDQILTFPTLPDPEENAAMLATAVLDLNGGYRPDFVGGAVAGEVSDSGLTIVRAGELQKFGWVGEPLKEMLASANGVPIKRTEIVNDAASAGYAQRAADLRRRMKYLLDGGQGYIETVSSGNGGAVFDANGSENVEPGHTRSGEKAPVQCGCTGEDCIEAWIGGNAAAEAWGERMENVDVDDPRWDEYQEIFNQMQGRKLEALRQRGYDPRFWYMFGSVALKGPRNILGDFASSLTSDPNHAMPVAAATYGDNSGLYGAHFFVRERQELAA